jgi:hypothetical protein
MPTLDPLLHLDPVSLCIGVGSGFVGALFFIFFMYRQ